MQAKERSNPILMNSPKKNINLILAAHSDSQPIHMPEATSVSVTQSSRPSGQVLRGMHHYYSDAL